jgi:hypothetical protein
MTDTSACNNKHALVEWLNGEDEGTMSIIAAAWIRNYEPGDESNICEWRVGKMPAMGWIVYDAKVIKLSSKKHKL